MPAEATGVLRPYPVWDRVVRWFHWINFICVVALASIGTAILWGDELGLTDAGKILLKTVHVWFGYVLAVNLGWRLIWAFIGPPWARWAALLPGGRGFESSLGGYLRGLGGRQAPAYVGHNPLARFMVSFLLLVLFLQVLGGLVLAGTDIYYPPLGSVIAKWVAAPGVDPAIIRPYDQTGIDPDSWAQMRAFRAPVVEVHEILFWVIISASVIHVLAVVLAELREGGALISAMFTGRKYFDRTPVDVTGPAASPGQEATPGRRDG